jgi:methionyl-tRNA formyltransferase
VPPSRPKTTTLPDAEGGLVLLGTSAFAAAVLEGLARGPHRPSLVVTRPDARQGRGRRVAPPPVAETARTLGIEVIQPPSVNDDETRARIAEAAPADVVLCAFGALVKEPLLAEHEILNVHPSLLPRWRGAAPVERAMMAGDAQTGVSIMRLVAELDAGPVYASEAEEIRPEDDYASLAARLQSRSVALLTHVLDERPQPVPQAEDGVTYAEKLGPEDRTLDPARPAADNVLVVRALHPHIGARVALPDGGFLGIHEARVGDDGALELLTVQPAGGRAMSYADYLRGGHPAPAV